MLIWEARHPLAVDEEGVLWHWDERRRWTRLGPIGSADPPPGQAAARAELLDLWSDRFDPRAEQLAGYWGSTAPAAANRASS